LYSTRIPVSAGSYRAIDPNPALIHWSLAKGLNEPGRFDELLTSYQRALEFEPQCEKAMIGASHLYEAMHGIAAAAIRRELHSL